MLEAKELRSSQGRHMAIFHAWPQGCHLTATGQAGQAQWARSGVYYCSAVQEVYGGAGSVHKVRHQVEALEAERGNGHAQGRSPVPLCFDAGESSSTRHGIAALRPSVATLALL